MEQHSLTPATRKLSAESKYSRCRFAPTDDLRLKACKTQQELMDAIKAVIHETGYPRRSVVNRAKTLGVWDQLGAAKRYRTIQEEHFVCKVLQQPPENGDLLSKIANKLNIKQSAALKLIYKKDKYVTALNEGTFLVREVASLLCIRRATVHKLINDGVLTAKASQAKGKFRIFSDSLVRFVKDNPRLIDWERCMRKSTGLMDVLESSRIAEIGLLFCVEPKTVRSWIDKGELKLPFDANSIGEYFEDEHLFRFLGEYPDAVDVIKCSLKWPEWFVKYEKVKGKYAKKAIVDNNTDEAVEASMLTLRLSRRR